MNMLTPKNIVAMAKISYKHEGFESTMDFMTVKEIIEIALFQMKCGNKDKANGLFWKLIRGFVHKAFDKMLVNQQKAFLNFMSEQSRLNLTVIHEIHSRTVDKFAAMTPVEAGEFYAEKLEKHIKNCVK